MSKDPGGVAEVRVDRQKPQARWESLSPTRQAGIRAASPLVDLGTFAVLLFLGFAVRDHATTNQLIVWVAGTLAIGPLRHVVWMSARWEDLQPGRITRPDLAMAGTSIILGLWLVYFWRTMVPPDDAVVIGICLVGMTAWWATSISVLSASPLAFTTVSVFTATAPLIGAAGRPTAFDSSLWLMLVLAGGISISYVDRRRSYLRSVRAEDEVLRQVAQRLRTRVGETGTVYRPGGDEFVIVASCPDRSAAEALADGLVTDSRTPVTVDSDRPALDVTLSVGMAHADSHAASNDLLHHADLAMYEAKQAGRDGWKASPAIPAGGV